MPWPVETAARYRERGYWAGVSLHEDFARTAATHPHRIALVCGERRWTYQALAQSIERFAAGLHGLGIGQRDRVLLQLPNIAEFHVACQALFRLGALPVFALPAHRRAEVGYFVEHAQAVAAIVADLEGGFDHRVLMREVAGSQPSLRTVVVVGQAQEFHAFDALYRDGPLPPLPDAGEVAFLQLSGGSTGLPKLIARTHDDYLYSVRESARLCALGPDTVYLCALPAAHNFPMSSPGALGVFHAGGCVVMARRPDATACFELIARERVTLTAVVPALALAWLQARPRTRQDLSSLRVMQVGGANLAESVARRIPEAFGCRLQQVFGMAEGLVNYTRLDDDEARVFTTQGRPISQDDEIRVVDDDDREVGEGEPGHLQVRGPYTIRGYYRAPAHDAQAFTADGYYRTGDCVQRLPGNYLRVVGRDKDQVNRGGDKIAAPEVEAHLLTHPRVHDAALVAMPDRWLGEKSCAWVVPNDPDDPPDAAALRAFLRERGIAAFKLPDRIEFVDALPRTAVGKVDKNALKQRALHLHAPTASPAPQGTVP